MATMASRSSVLSRILAPSTLREGWTRRRPARYRVRAVVKYRPESANARNQVEAGVTGWIPGWPRD